MFLDEIMNTRLNLERYMSKNELQKFDIELKQLLTRDNLKDAVLKHLDQELITANILKKNYVKPQDYEDQEDFEKSKFDDYTKAINKRIKNPEALKKFYAYDSVRTNMTKTQLKLETFENYEKHIMTMDMLVEEAMGADYNYFCLLYTSPSPRDLSTSRMPSSA